MQGQSLLWSHLLIGYSLLPHPPVQYSNLSTKAAETVLPWLLLPIYSKSWSHLQSSFLKSLKVFSSQVGPTLSPFRYLRSLVPPESRNCFSGTCHWNNRKKGWAPRSCQRVKLSQAGTHTPLWTTGNTQNLFTKMSKISSLLKQKGRRA